MDQTLKMPDLATVNDGVNVLRWLAPLGARIGRGDAILEVETDKATVAVESVVTGTIREQLVQAGDVVAAGAPIALVEVAGPAPASERETAGSAQVERDPTPERAPSGRPGGGGKSFFARNRDDKAS